MRKVLLLLSIILLITSLLIGCNSQVDINTSESIDVGGKVDGKDLVKVKSKEDIINNDTSHVNKEVNFRQFFSEEKLSYTQDFLNSIISEFKMGMTKEHIINNLGYPDEKLSKQSYRGEEVNWIFMDVEGFQLTLMLVDDIVINFELNKYFSSHGTIPKIVNKDVPRQGASIEYNELGFEGVILGSNIEEVLNFYGEPIRSYLSNDEMYGYDLVMIYKGLSVHILLEQDQPSVQFFETNEFASIDTYRNISVGSSLNDVITNYGQPEYDGWRDTGFIIYSTTNYWSAIKFEIADNKVVNISIYNAS